MTKCKHEKKKYNISGSGYAEIKAIDNKLKNMEIIEQKDDELKKSNGISKEKLNKFVNFKFK